MGNDLLLLGLKTAGGKMGEVNDLIIEDLINEAKRIASKYYQITGRPLGITGEVGERTAASVLGLKLADVR